MKGWFDAFRSDGGPTLYSFNNRTAVTGDVTVITFLAIFSTLYVAFLIIFPGIRKEVNNSINNLCIQTSCLVHSACQDVATCKTDFFRNFCQLLVHFWQYNLNNLSCMHN